MLAPAFGIAIGGARGDRGDRARLRDRRAPDRLTSRRLPAIPRDRDALRRAIFTVLVNNSDRITFPWNDSRPMDRRPNGWAARPARLLVLDR